VQWHDDAMATPCFRKKDSNRPVCGVQNVPLEPGQLPSELIASGYMSFAFLACLVSCKVLNDAATHK
jgi:hypothetical protein